MAKSKHHHFIDTVDDCLSNAVKQGIFHLNTQDEAFNGRQIQIKNKQVINFGSCSYLGLEMDERLKQGSIDATLKFGTQFSSSRAYLSCGMYEELEFLFSQIFGANAIVSPTTTLGHLSAIPSLVRDDDAVIIDHQVHGSVQNAVQLLKPRRIHVEMIRHNNLEHLEEKIIELKNKHRCVWYMADGVYSMYGDYAPAKELYSLLEKYDHFRLYVDDAHGMSWRGENGKGYILDEISLHPNMVLATSLAKGFGSGGGVLVFPNPEDMRKVRTCGSTFVFSGPIQPSVLGASIASAQIHLSDEIYELQDQLHKRIAYCDSLIREKQLPYVLPSTSPIFYIGLGLPRTGYNIINKLINEGFYVDLGIFPGVPVKRTGVRLAISNGQTMEDIKNVVEAIDHYLPIVLEEENETIQDLSKYFRMNFDVSSVIKEQTKKINKDLRIEHYRSIKEVSPQLWNNFLGDRGSFDWEGCKFLEETFIGNPEKENNWNFHYYIIYDENNEVVLCTFFTELWTKDDMLAPESVSKQVEEKRTSDPYYLTSKVMMMGSLLTEGEHLYLNRENGMWKQAFVLLLEDVREEQEKCKASAIQLRDFDSDDQDLSDFLVNEGFIKIDMPDTFVLENVSDWENIDEYLGEINRKQRYHVRKYCIDRESEFYIEKLVEVDNNKVDLIYNLYLNVQKEAFLLNTYPLPKKIFKKFIQNKFWDVITICIKETGKMVACSFNYKSAQNYCVMAVGFDYEVLLSHEVYRQSLFQSIKEANKNGYTNVYLGMSADVEKRKFNATRKNKVVFVQLQDSFNLEIINLDIA